MNTPWKADLLHPKAREGIELFNQREFYQAHEHLEKAWMDAASPERDLYQGILQIGLAYYQISLGNYRGALKMFRRGLRNLSPLGESLLGVDIHQLVEDARDAEAALRARGPRNISQLIDELIKPVPEQR